MKPLKEIYNLSNDLSGLDYGLIHWYNELIDKSYDNLTTADACKMIRQNVLKNIAIKKVIELFLKDPYDGEFFDGGLLDVLNSLDISSLGMLYIEKIKTVLRVIQQEYIDFDWFDDEAKNKYAKNIDLMITKIESME